MRARRACSLYMLLIVGVFMCALVCIHYTFIWGNGRLGETGNWLLNGLIEGNGSISDC